MLFSFRGAPMPLENKSIWSVTAPNAEPYPTLNGSISADVAIVGGGISGITCAYFLAKAGQSVVVLEADRIGMRTTGHSTGNLYNLVDKQLHGLLSKWGLETAKDVVRSRSAAIDTIESIVRDNGIDCAFERVVFTYFSEAGAKSTLRTL